MVSMAGDKEEGAIMMIKGVNERRNGRYNTS